VSDRRSVLLVHGMSSSQSTWWRVGPQLDSLGWDVTTVDLAGHGGRPLGPVRSVVDLAQDVARRCPESRTVVVGHSLGAIVALELVTLLPAYARGVVLEDPPALRRDRASDDIAEEIGREVVRARADPHVAIAAILAGHPGWTRRDARSVLEGRLQTDPVLARLSPGAITWDLTALVADSPVPVAVLAAAGADSALLEPDRSELRRQLPPGRLTEVPGSHHVHLDEPDAWVEAVDRFGRSLNEH
jgi:pimeloyl-ACP methyl ester carboxylesterase